MALFTAFEVMTLGYFVLLLFSYYIFPRHFLWSGLNLNRRFQPPIHQDQHNLQELSLPTPPSYPY